MTTVPLSGTIIELLKGVPLTSDYKNTLWFDTIDQQINYFSGATSVKYIEKANFQRIETSHILKINAHIETLWEGTYLRFKNTSYGSKWFYAFVTQLEYVNSNLTNVHFQIDVLQTWMFDFEFKQSFVAREHTKLWNTDGSPVVNTLDEGLAYGSDYDVVKIEQIKPQNGLYFLVVATKRSVNVKNGNGDYIINPNVNGIVQPLSYYLLPFTPDGNTPDVYIGGTKITLGSVQATLQELYKNDEAVNNIASLYVTDHIGYDVAYDGTKCTLSNTNFASFKIGDSDVNIINVLALPSYSSTLKSLGDKYSGFKTVKESKLLMHPYTVITLTDSKGSSIDVRPEFIKNNNLEIRIRGSIGTSNKTAYMMDDYNYSSSQGLSTISALENAIINNDPNDVPVITDMLSAYLQGNRNSLTTQKAQIQYNQQMNAVTGTVQTMNGAMNGAITGGMTGGVVGGIGGGLIGALSGIGQTMQNTVNSQFQIASLMSKQEDVSNVPPSLSKLGSNIAFDFGNGVQGVYVIKRQIKQEYIDRLTDYFNMYGYKVNLVKVPNLHTRQKWNYVQTVNANITGDLPNQDIQQIKNIFDSGVTLWHVGSTWCDYSQDNGVI